MAKRRNRGRRRSPSLVLLGTTAAGLSTVLVFGHATDTTAAAPQVQLASAVIGIGGRGDPASANIPQKLHRNPATGVADGTIFPRPGFATYVPVNYPAGFDIDNSVAQGVPALHNEITTRPGQALLVVGYSEGALVAERERRNLAADPGTTDPEDINYIMIASANLPNGGIFARFPDLNLFIVSSNGAAQPSESDTTYYTNEYDPYADFPAYFNPLSLLNSLAAVQYAHPDVYYDTVDPDAPAPIVKTVTNTAGGTDTYIFIPAAHLPLFALPRQIFGVIGLTPLTEPVLSAIEPVLRLLVDMGYTDRENLNPEVHVQFSLITPPERILQTVAATPAAITQGANNFVNGVTSIPASVPAPVAPTLAPADPPSINARSAPQAPQQDSTNNTLTAPEVTDPSPPALPSGPSTPPTKNLVSPLAKTGPTLGKLTDDGHKFTPNGTGSTTSPGKNSPFSQLTEAFTGLLGGNQAPPSTPAGAEPNSPPADSTQPQAS